MDAHHYGSLRSKSGVDPDTAKDPFYRCAELSAQGSDSRAEHEAI